MGEGGIGRAGRAPPARGRLRESCGRASCRPHAPRRQRGRLGRRWERTAGVQCVWAASAARWPGGLGVCRGVCAHVRVDLWGASAWRARPWGAGCARESGECAGGVCACSPGGRAGWSRREERGRAGLCARVCARGRRHPLSRGLTAVPEDAARVRPLSLPPRSFPEPSTLPPPRPASPLRSDRDPPLGSSKARRGAGRPRRLPARPLAGRRGAAGGGRKGEKRQDAAAAAAEEPGPSIPVPALRGPASPAFPSRAPAPPQPPALQPAPHVPSRPPVFSRSPSLSLVRLSLSFPLPHSFLSFPGALFFSHVLESPDGG